MPLNPPPSAEGRGTPEELARERAVLERIAASAEPDGFVPFDRFMEIALYADGIGFYANRANPLGPAGDFYTASYVHPLFGRALARRVKEVRDLLPTEAPFRIVELGPGDGTLAVAILEALGRENDPGSRYSYVLVERSASRGISTLERAREVGARRCIPVVSAGHVGGTGPFAGVVIANEVLDAQPVRRLVYRGGTWRELGVRRSGDLLEPAESTPVSPLPRGVPPSPRDGEIWEDAAAVAGVLRGIADHLLAGVAIIVDYGMEEPELRSAHSTGTLAAVRRHRPVEEPWAHPGLVDLSTFVNFTRVRADAGRSGLREIAYSSQAEALGRWGFAELLQETLRSAPSAEARVKAHLAAKSLLFGFERFQVLELAPPLPTGPVPT